jgi:hypothetical protein
MHSPAALQAAGATQSSTELQAVKQAEPEQL